MAVRGLVYHNARLGGELRLLQKLERKLQDDLDEITARLAEVRAEIVKSEARECSLAQAAMTSFQIDISSTEPRYTWPKDQLTSLGELSRSIHRLLALAKDKGLPILILQFHYGNML